MNTYSFAAIRGVQAGRAYYVVMVPLRMVGRLFRFDDEDLAPALRAQRDLNKGRIPAIARYLVEHPRDYVLSALSATIDGAFQFQASAEHGAGRSVGVLLVDMTATILINDGQHRRAGIVEALRNRPHLGDETIAVTLYPDADLARSQQIFVDLNQHGIRPARSLRLLYDARDDEAQLSRNVVEAIPLLRDLTDFARSNLPSTSRKLFTFSNLHGAIGILVREAGLTQNAEAEVVTFWQQVIEAIPDWGLAAQGRIAASELRRDKVHAHGTALEAIATVGARLMACNPRGWGEDIGRLQTVDWNRSNAALWEGRAMFGGRIHRSRTAVALTAEALFRAVRSNLPDAPLRVG